MRSSGTKTIIARVGDDRRKETGYFVYVNGSDGRLMMGQEDVRNNDNPPLTATHDGYPLSGTTVL
jgi:hypothetical protein